MSARTYRIVTWIVAAVAMACLTGYLVHDGPRDREALR